MNMSRTPILPRALGWGGLACLLALPAVAMLFTDEVAWTRRDFVFAALMFTALGLGTEAAVRLLPRGALRWLGMLAVLGVVLLIWADGAVGIF